MPGRVGRRREDRGAVLMMTAVLSSIFMVMAAFTVDLGMQRVVRRDMQALADVVALDLARLLDGSRDTSTLVASQAWRDALAQSLARNNGTLDVTPTVVATPGRLDVAGEFVTTTETEVPTAVRVSAQGDVEFGFVGREGGATRQAVATAEARACMRLGSFALAISSAQSSVLAPLINRALGSGVTTSLVGYQGLATANVTVLDLLDTGLGAGTVDELLDLDNVTVRDFNLAILQVLQRRGDTANVALLQTINATMSPLGTIDIGRLFHVAGGGDSALATELNVLDLVAGAAFLSNGDHWLDVPALSASLPILGTNANVQLQIIEGPREACGPVGTRVETAQVKLRITGTAANIAVPGVVTTNYPVSVQATLASARARITSVACGAGTALSPHTVGLAVNSDLASMSTQIGDVTLQALNLLGVKVNVLELGLRAATTSRNMDKAVTLQYPANVTTPVRVGAEEPLPGVTVSVTKANVLNLSLLNLLGLTVNGIVNGVTSNLVNPLTAQLNALITGTLNPMLGLTLGGADAYVGDSPPPTCTQPKLRG